MEIKARAFPHPVLAPESDDYSEGHVVLLDAAVEAAPERYTLRFRFEVTHSDFQRMLADGSASAAVVVECRENLYRVRHGVSLGENRIEISADELRGEVQITPVISAARSLADFRPHHLNRDYDGIAVAIPTHALLGYGPNLVFEADPRADRLRRVSSIMRVRRADFPDQLMRINHEGTRILVDVSSETYARYRGIASSRDGVAILASMLVLPVLVEVFHRVKAVVPDAREDFRARRWYRLVSQRLNEIGESIDVDGFDPLRAAQKLLDAPFARGISELFKKLELGSDK